MSQGFTCDQCGREQPDTNIDHIMIDVGNEGTPTKGGIDGEVDLCRECMTSVFTGGGLKGLALHKLSQAFQRRLRELNVGDC